VLILPLGDVEAPEAPWAVISVPGPRGVVGRVLSALQARESSDFCACCFHWAKDSPGNGRFRAGNSLYRQTFILPASNLSLAETAEPSERIQGNAGCGVRVPHRLANRQRGLGVGVAACRLRWRWDSSWPGDQLDLSFRGEVAEWPKAAVC